jgi:uncharacterized protein
MSAVTSFERALALWIAWIARRPWSVLLVVLCASGAGGWYAVTHIGINTNTADMISPELEWRVRYRDYKNSFPALQNTLTVVIDAASKDAALAASRRLRKALLGDASGMFARAEDIEDLEFFRRHGLLYLSPSEIESLGERLTRAQPLLGFLAAQPGTSRMFDLLARMRADDDASALSEGSAFVKAVTRAVRGAVAQRTDAIAWRELLDPDASDEATNGALERRIIVVGIALDYSELLPAGPAMARVREVARQLQLAEREGARIRITGGAAMAHEELASVSRGMGTAGLLALALVVVTLSVGLKSLRLALATLITLVCGLVLTGAYAAATVGSLNLISVAFAVLYIGLGADYAAHYLLRYRELGAETVAGLVQAGRDVGVSLVLCALTTCIGFLAFVPTDFVGVSELGIISSGGMLISLLTSLTLLPALVVLMGINVRCDDVSAPAARWSPTPKSVLVACAALVVLAALALPQLRFDHNPLNLRDPDSESVATYLDLMRDGVAPPWTLSVLVSPTQASAVAATLAAVAKVRAVRSPENFVPTAQDRKLAMLDDLSLTLGPDFGGDMAALVPTSPEGLSASLDAYEKAAAGHPGDTTRWSALDSAVRELREVASGSLGAKTLAHLEAALFRYLPAQLVDLRLAMTADAVLLADLPEAIRARWIASDGRWRVQARPIADLNDNSALEAFVEAVQAVAPQATGTPEVNLGASRVVSNAFVQALVSAMFLVALVLWLLTGSVRDCALVLLPLLAAGIVMCGVMVVLDLKFNFANVICLPLLLGIGVDNGVHIVHRMRPGGSVQAGFLSTSTSRAIILSAVTTVCSFGSLAWSVHPGTASMGQVLSIGLVAMVITTLLLLPAMLSARQRVS